MISCHVPKVVAEEEQKVTDQNPNTGSENYSLGEVQILDCGVVIQISSGETRDKYVPINLDSKFQIDKLRLKLKFKALDEKATVCSEFKAIEITEVFAVR